VPEKKAAALRHKGFGEAGYRSPLLVWPWHDRKTPRARIRIRSGTIVAASQGLRVRPGGAPQPEPASESEAGGAAVKETFTVLSLSMVTVFVVLVDASSSVPVHASTW
jgi:hypothetical protein